MVEVMYTKEDLIALFRKFGIHKGMIVLVEASGSMQNYIAGGEQMVIEVLKELLGSQGCIIAPSFTFETLDPATQGDFRFDYSSWNEVRESLFGFDKRLSQSRNLFANQLMLNPGSERSNHAVYSFVIHGKFDSKTIRQSANYPVSFDSVFKPMLYRDTGILCFDKSPLSSSIFYALTRNTPYEESIVLRAYKQKGKEKEVQTFLMNNPLEFKIRQFLKNKEKIHYADLGNHDISCFALDMRSDNKDAVFFKN